jgi:mannose-6-phosphate isomerase-like protein (cupin superfamily)
MHITSKDERPQLKTAHGELIHELIGRTTDRPTERLSVAFVVIPPGKASLFHRHLVTEESYYILQGRAHLQLGNEETTIEQGEIVLIPTETPHKISNIGNEDLEFLAFCAPAWEESDSYY